MVYVVQLLLRRLGVLCGSIRYTASFVLAQDTLTLCLSSVSEDGCGSSRNLSLS